MARLFICYKHEEKSYAFAVRQWLIDAQGWRPEDIFVDVTHIPGGQLWEKKLLTEAEAAEVVLFLASDLSLDHRSFCYRELQQAKGQILVVTIRGVQPDDERFEYAIPSRAKSRQIVALDKEPTEPFRFVSPINNANDSVGLNATEVENIGKVLRDLGVAPDSFSWTPTDARPYPYPGLRPLMEGDEALFFGRNIEIRDALRALEELRQSVFQRAFLIQAPSGAGKSSLLRAGLWQRLRTHAAFTPLGIVRAAKGLVHHEEWGLVTALYDSHAKRLKLSRDEIKTRVGEDLAGLLAEIADRDGGESGRRTLLLGIDQAEEMTALSDAEASELDEVLGRLLSLPNGIDLRLVLTARDDSVDATRDRLARAGLPQHQVTTWPLGRLPRTRFRDIIADPADAAQRAGWPLAIDDALVDALAAAAGDNVTEIGDPLPILALALQRMVAGRRAPDNGRITLRREEARHFIETAVGEAVKEALWKADAGQDELRRLVIPRLVSWDPRAGSEGAAKCRVASAGDLFASTRDGLEKLARALVNEHLLTCSGRDGGAVYEVAHEALLRAPPLGPLIHDRRDHFELAHDLKAEARAWVKAGRPEERLARKNDSLDKAKELFEDEDFAHDLKRPETSVEAYLAACERKQENDGKSPPIMGLLLDDGGGVEKREWLLSSVKVLGGGGVSLVLSLLLLPQWVSVFLIICWLFWALDEFGDPGFRKTISETLGVARDSNTEIAKASLAVFDFVYTLPLLLTPKGRDRRRRLGSAEWTPFEAWWALVSSGVIALIITSILTYYAYYANSENGIWTTFVSLTAENGVWTTFVSGIAVNTLSDYLAVLVIRRWLDRDMPNPEEALFFALFAGLLLVISFTGLRLVLFMAAVQFFNNFPPPADVSQCFPSADFCMPGNPPLSLATAYLGTWDKVAVQQMWLRLRELHLPGILAACIVHLWLPVFAFSVYGLKLFNLGRRLDFIERHPLVGLGIVAGAMGVVVFLVVRGIYDLPQWLLLSS